MFRIFISNSLSLMHTFLLYITIFCCISFPYIYISLILSLSFSQSFILLIHVYTHIHIHIDCLLLSRFPLSLFDITIKKYASSLILSILKKKLSTPVHVSTGNRSNFLNFFYSMLNLLPDPFPCRFTINHCIGLVAYISAISILIHAITPNTPIIIIIIFIHNKVYHHFINYILSHSLTICVHAFVCVFFFK